MTVTTKFDYKDTVIHKEDRKTHKIWNTEIRTKINWAGQVETTIHYQLDLSRRWWNEKDLTLN